MATPAQALTKWTETEGNLNQTALGETLGVSQQAVHAWCKGSARPSERLWAAIEKLTGIPAEHWLSVIERRERKRLAALTSNLPPRAA